MILALPPILEGGGISRTNPSELEPVEDGGEEQAEAGDQR